MKDLLWDFAAIPSRCLQRQVLRQYPHPLVAGWLRTVAAPGPKADWLLWGEDWNKLPDIRQPGERVVWVDVFRLPENQSLVRDTMTPAQRRAYGTMLGMREVAWLVGRLNYLPSPSRRRGVHGEPLEIKTRPRLRCRKPFESEGPHNRMCNGVPE